MKSKRFFVMLLAVILLVVCAIPSVYSWYDHNGLLSGDKMGYTRSKLPVSAGDISFQTKKYYMDDEKRQGGSPNNVYYDLKGNKEYNGNAITSGSVSAGHSQFYGTTFTNTGSSPAYVNLYLQNLTNSNNVYIGTTSPSLTHKGLSSSVHLANKNKVRVYFQWDKANIWKDPGSRTYVISETAVGTKTVTQFNTTTNKLENKPELSNVTTYYADLADNAVSFYFATDAGVTGNVNTTTGEVTQAWYRTRTITKIQAERGYYLTGTADDTTWNAKYNTFSVPGGLSIKTNFDKADINKNQHAYITLNNGTNYTGASATYTLTSGNNITVNNNTGYITASNSFGTGTNIAQITTTVTGALGDTMQVVTNISNPTSLASAPVALNVKVPGATTEEVDGQQVQTPGKAEIVWYIDNSNGTGAVSFNNVYYTK